MSRPKPPKPRVTVPKGAGASLAKAIAAGDPQVIVAPEAAPTDWELAFLALFAEDAFQTARRTPGADLARVAPDPRLSPHWSVVGTLTAVDAVLRIGRHKFGARRVFYGWLLRSAAGRLVLVIRGTGTRVEWLIDCAFAPRTAHPVAGRVESGFWDVFTSMRLDDKPLSSISGDMTVVGHSLGAALATYASLELSRSAKVRGVFVASPHPGDSTFCLAFGAAVPNHVMYRNVADLVPRVPFWFGYADVPNVNLLSAKQAGIRITGGAAGQHHVLTYAALMDRASIKAFDPLPIDRQFLDCVHI